MSSHRRSSRELLLERRSHEHGSIFLQHHDFADLSHRMLRNTRGPQHGRFPKFQIHGRSYRQTTLFDDYCYSGHHLFLVYGYRLSGRRIGVKCKLIILRAMSTNSFILPHIKLCYFDDIFHSNYGKSLRVPLLLSNIIDKVCIYFKFLGCSDGRTIGIYPTWALLPKT